MAVLAAWKQLSTGERACLIALLCALLVLPVVLLLLLLPALPQRQQARQQEHHQHQQQQQQHEQQQQQQHARQPASDRNDKQQAQRSCLLDLFHSGKSPERRVFSQFGEDGITEAIFKCIHTTNKFYVEFGVETGTECGTRRLREEEGWTGLLMDGGHDIPAINLHKEFMTADNIASLFHKYNVPQAFDFLTVDLDLNTFYLIQAVLSGGFRPQALAVEYNSNFDTLEQSYAVEYVPEDRWDYASCYYGASALALTRLMRFYGYLPLIIDQANVNMFFIHSDTVGGPAGAAGGHSPDPDFGLAHGGPGGSGAGGQGGGPGAGGQPGAHGPEGHSPDPNSSLAQRGPGARGPAGGRRGAEVHTPDPDFTLAQALRGLQKVMDCALSQCGAFPWHRQCRNRTWVHVPEGQGFGGGGWARGLRRLGLWHDDTELNVESWWGQGKAAVPRFKTRRFVEVPL